jgi:DNA primase
VSDEGNYWHCFAGCSGGSVIDFWIKWRRCDFKTAVKELAKMMSRLGRQHIAYYDAGNGDL